MAVGLILMITSYLDFNISLALQAKEEGGVKMHAQNILRLAFVHQKLHKQLLMYLEYDSQSFCYDVIYVFKASWTTIHQFYRHNADILDGE